MPIALPPISRRQFLGTSLAAGASLLSQRWALGDERRPDRDRFALLADTHISGTAGEKARGVDMAENFRRVGAEIIAAESPPAAVLIGGDCAYLTGRTEDYATLVELLNPLRKSGLPIHLALGNHDHRDRFHDALPPRDGEDRFVEQKHTSVIESPRANWVVLDSLDETNKTPGVLGSTQLDWLAKALDERPDRPALVMVHHNPDERPRPGGLTDTKPLFDVLLPRRQVKALFYGHSHNWQIERRDGLHLVNLPPTAYVFEEGKPNGWVDLRLGEGGGVMELRCLDPAHPQHGQRTELTWRE